MIFEGKVGNFDGSGNRNMAVAVFYLIPEEAKIRAIFFDGEEFTISVESVFGTPVADWLRLVFAPDAPSAVERDASKVVLRLMGAGVIPSSDYFFAPGVSSMILDHKGGDADFTKLGNHVVDLSGADLSAVSFGNADFRGANIKGTRFSYAILGQSRFDPSALAGSDLRGAVLKDGTFHDFDLTGTDLTGARLTNTSILGGTCSNTKFDGATLDSTKISATLNGATFTGARGFRPSFANANLTNCRFDGARLFQPDFSGATLNNVSFAGALLAGANFSSPKAATFANDVDFGGADLQSADFTGADLGAGKVKSNPPQFGPSLEKRTKFVRAKVHSGFLGRNWKYLDCTGAAIAFAADFRGSELDASFAVLPRVDFGGQSLSAAKFIWATLHGANFANCDLEDSVFTSAILSGTDPGINAAAFTGADLILADFTSADLSGVSFSNANLRGAKFINSLLHLTDFANAFVAQVDFTAIRDHRMAGVSFAGACLVSADFKQTDIVSFLGKAPNFSHACLLGTNFIGATLSSANLTSAKLACKEGDIVARVRGAEFSLQYAPTQLPPSITGPQTQCPDGNLGPCDAERLRTEAPTEWVMPTLSS